MVECAAINASPLIFLARGRHLDLIPHFADLVLVPEPVAYEVQRKGPLDIAVKALESLPWLKVVSAPPPPDVILEWGLGTGESSVLALAYQRIGMEAIIDDLSARKCAAALSIPVRGTLGIVLSAKRRGVIPSARAVMEDLIEAGLFLSRRVLDDALRRVDE